MKQKFRFAELYRNNRAAVERALTAMWCGEARNESQKAYVSQLKGIIPELLAPKEAMPLVQCMNSYESVYPEHTAEAEEMVGKLWRKTLPQGVFYAPYEHQYQCWRTLLKDKSPDGKNMSIVVTTGTGSGKTECFMLPLVQDLIDNYVADEVQAIFLYPLNALMEDQKARMEKLLAGTNLRFAVYNGDLPQSLPSPEDKNYKKVLRKVDDIRGVIRDKDGNVVEEKYPHIIATREELRKHPANILLTNPTMLEYILLRDRDRRLVHEPAPGEKGTLRWIALDETHTYTGAGAAEIAMLIRRVLMAYGVTTDDVRFATSSATIGKKGDGSAEDELVQFVAGITGLQTNQIRLVDGKRKGMEMDSLSEADKDVWLRLMNENKDGFLKLDELIKEGESIEEKLEILDGICQRAEEAGLVDLRAKVHYFYRVPNQGLYVDLSNLRQDGSFEIHLNHNALGPEEGQAPLLEMSRCKHCGEYVAIAEELELDDGIGYQPIEMDDSDMFDLDEAEHTGRTFYVFGTSNSDEAAFDNNIPYIIQGNRLLNVTASNPAPKGWHVIANAQCQCPYCGTKLTKASKPDEDNPDAVQLDEEDEKRLQKFRVPADFISRLIAPSTLDLMTEFPSGEKEALCLHKGQQYISFVDSRQAAARATLKQNLEEERLWVYGTIFHELNRRANSVMTLEEAKKYYGAIYDAAPRRSPEQRDADQKLEILEGNDQEAIMELLAGLKPPVRLTWKEILELLLNDRYADVFCQQFAERSELSPELDENGNIRPGLKRKYILSIMVDYLSHRPLTAPNPETMGLFTSYYPALQPALKNELPEEVKAFNSEFTQEAPITQKDWHTLMQLFMDFTVRQSECVFLRMDDNDSVDIFECVRFATQKEIRRPVRKPEVQEKGSNRSRLIRLLAKLIAEKKNITLSDAIISYRNDIQKVIDCLWRELTDSYRLLESSTHYDDEAKTHVADNDLVVDGIHFKPYRLNLLQLGFKPYENPCLCDTNAGDDTHHVEWLRPVEATFHGYSPFIVGGEVVKPSEMSFEDWQKNGEFSDRIQQIKDFPELFIQAEHTAQVDKMISRQVQEDFRKHCLNILACSTTMEMGVDLGDLELVMMTSVPPMPSNYKQRAGRSGRRGQTRSACITLCGSDAVGIRTLFNPMENVILRNVSTPTVDLNSVQVIQRHVNAFLIREFGVFGLAGGSVTEQVISYYTNYEIVPDGDSNHIKIKKRLDHAPVSPIDGLGDETGTPYDIFNSKCIEALDEKLTGKLKLLLHNTILGSLSPQLVLQKAREMNESCYAELELRIQDYAEPYRTAKSAKQQAFFEMKFIEPLAARLLAYWATHRFIPNANMPVNVIEFDINSSQQSMYSLLSVSNPSYPLRTALSQYAPGNPIARDGLVRIVRGIRYTNFFKPEVTFKKLFFNREQVVIDSRDELSNLEKWKVSGSTELDLLQPAEFIPDINESASRILDTNIYTRVSAQLIGAEEWKQDRIEPHLFDARSSRESGNGQILYYNEGKGFGYCHCTKCGKTVLENWSAAASSDPTRLPSGMNPIPSKESDKPNYHYSLVKTGRKPSRCIGCNSINYIKRNVVLGDTIQTDYTEIRIRHLNQDWINSSKNEKKLLVTLGLLFTRALAEELNVERTDLDFTITPTGHICIFDANPGGSGYSNQLAEMDLLKSVIEHSSNILNAAEVSGNREALIDRFTLHYVNNLDIKAAKAWIEEECSARKVLPAPIKKVFGDNVTETSLAKMLKAFVKCQRERTLFVDDCYNHWNYDGSELCWKGTFLSQIAPCGSQTTLCLAENSDAVMPVPAKDMLRSIAGWAKDVRHIKNRYFCDGLYPLAYFDGRLYFTNNPAHTALNAKWGNGTIYYIKEENFAAGANMVDIAVKGTTKIFKFMVSKIGIVRTREIGERIYAEAKDIIDSFVEHCKSLDEKLVIKYKDEHLKNVLGMIITLQTIEWLARRIGKDFEVSFVMENYFETRPEKEGIAWHFPTSHARDEKLQSLCESWLHDLKEIHGSLGEILSESPNTLTHWRELSISCGGKKLVIYPDGGFANGWQPVKKYDRPVDERDKCYTKCGTTTQDNISIQLSKDIKFDVTIEDE